jgi:hypothetical protein
MRILVVADGRRPGDGLSPPRGLHKNPLAEQAMND